jgi:hypothetical protein
VSAPSNHTVSRITAVAMLGSVSKTLDEQHQREVRRRKNALGEALLAIAAAAGTAFDAITPDAEDFDAFADRLGAMEDARDRLVAVLTAITKEARP